MFEIAGGILLACAIMSVLRLVLAAIFIWLADDHTPKAALTPPVVEAEYSPFPSAGIAAIVTAVFVLFIAAPCLSIASWMYTENHSLVYLGIQIGTAIGGIFCSYLSFVKAKAFVEMRQQQRESHNQTSRLSAAV